MICCVQLYYKVEAKDGTISLTRITSQDNPAIEIIHFGRTGLNGLCPNKFFILNRGRLLEGEKWLVYWYMPAILHSVSFLFSPVLSLWFFPTIFFSFLMLAHVVLWWWWCCDFFIVVAIVHSFLPYCARREPFIYYLPRLILSFWPLTTFV